MPKSLSTRNLSKVHFGPSGIPLRCEGTGTLDGVNYCAELGLEAMEIEFVRGVRMKQKQAEEIGRTAEEKGIILSCHAPYFINLCSSDEEKIANSKRHIFEAAQALYWAGGRIAAFHPGYYQKLSKEDAYTAAKKNLQAVGEKLEQHSINTVLGAENVGKKSQFGGLEEVIRLSQELDFVEPTIDFCHLVARGDFQLRNEDDYRKLFALLEKELGDYVYRFHSHFSEVNYTEKGERNHEPLDSGHLPPYKPLMKVLAENGYCGVIISESPLIENDALKMQEEYARALFKSRT